MTDQISNDVPENQTAGEVHAERITEVFAQEPGEDRTIRWSAEVHLSCEISERAPTKDRPEPTYGTSSKVSITTLIDDPLLADLANFVQDKHEQQEAGMQVEIVRRKAIKKYLAENPDADAPMDDVPF